MLECGKGEGGGERLEERLLQHQQQQQEESPKAGQHSRRQQNVFACAPPEYTRSLAGDSAMRRVRAKVSLRK